MGLFSSKDIMSKDADGKLHGYVELWDNEDDEITQRGVWRHGRLFGYHEWHPDYIMNTTTETEYYIR
jgi:hypothetical protein